MASATKSDNRIERPRRGQWPGPLRSPDFIGKLALEVGMPRLVASFDLKVSSNWHWHFKFPTGTRDPGGPLCTALGIMMPTGATRTSTASGSPSLSVHWCPLAASATVTQAGISRSALSPGLRVPCAPESRTSLPANSLASFQEHSLRRVGTTQSCRVACGEGAIDSALLMNHEPDDVADNVSDAPSRGSECESGIG